MAKNSRIIRAARVASGLTQEQAARLIDVSTPTYIARERVPKAFTIDELERLYTVFNGESKTIIETFINDIFC